jgi:hypothetical protein
MVGTDEFGVLTASVATRTVGGTPAVCNQEPAPLQAVSDCSSPTFYRQILFAESVV